MREKCEKKAAPKGDPKPLLYTTTLAQAFICVVTLAGRVPSLGVESDAGRVFFESIPFHDARLPSPHVARHQDARAPARVTRRLSYR